MRKGPGINSCNVNQNVSHNGDEPILLRVDIEGRGAFAFCVHKGKRIELYDYETRRPVWSADLSSLC